MATEFNSVITRFVPAAYYRFSTGALTTDTSAGGHTLTAISDPAEDASGEFDGAVALDGNDAYSAVDHADFKPTGNWTIGAWIKTSQTGAFRSIFASYSQNTNNAGIQFLIWNDNTLRIMSAKNTGTTADVDYKLYAGNNTSFCDGNWHFVVATWDSAKLHIFLDGIEDGAGAAWANAPAYAVTNYVRIGCRSVDGSDSLFITGSLDDVWLLNGRALSSTDISNLYGTYPTIASTNYLKYFRRATGV